MQNTGLWAQMNNYELETGDKFFSGDDGSNLRSLDDALAEFNKVVCVEGFDSHLPSEDEIAIRKQIARLNLEVDIRQIDELLQSSTPIDVSWCFKSY